METTVYLVHGIFTARDNERTDLLRPYYQAEGAAVIELDYGWRGPLAVWLTNNAIAKRFARQVKPGSIGVGHSNGAMNLIRQCEAGAPYAGLVLINPALDKDCVFPPQLKFIHIWHSPSDKPVKWASRIPGVRWGEMGATGYTGEDMRAINFNKEDDFLPHSSSEHSDVFEGENLKFFAPKIVRYSLDALKQGGNYDSLV